MPKNIVAYTPSGSYPPYLSINETDSGDISVTVRSPAKPDGSCGDSATIVVPRSEWRFPILSKLMAGQFKNEDGE